MNRCDICGKFRKYEDLRLIPHYDDKAEGTDALAICGVCDETDLHSLIEPPDCALELY